MNTYNSLSDKKVFVNRTLKSGSLTKLTPPVPRPLHKSPANAHWIPLISSTCIPRQTIWRCLDFVASPEPRFLYAACWNMLESDRGSSKLSPYLGSHKMVRWFKTLCKMLHPEHVSDPIYSLHQPAMFHVRWKKSEGSWVADHLLHARCQDTFEFFPSRPRSHGKLWTAQAASRYNVHEYCK